MVFDKLDDLGGLQHGDSRTSAARNTRTTRTATACASTLRLLLFVEVDANPEQGECYRQKEYRIVGENVDRGLLDLSG
jgi:hypothetical protein